MSRADLCRAARPGNGVHDSDPAGRGVGIGDELLVANSLSGEECRIRSTLASTSTDRLEQFDINCAGWQEPSGFVWRSCLGAPTGGPRAAPGA